MEGPTLGGSRLKDGNETLTFEIHRYLATLANKPKDPPSKPPRKPPLARILVKTLRRNPSCKTPHAKPLIKTPISPSSRQPQEFLVMPPRPGQNPACYIMAYRVVSFPQRFHADLSICAASYVFSLQDLSRLPSRTTLPQEPPIPSSYLLQDSPAE
ncbi:hypothetical protein H0H92_009964 [Tricholoma furcatifolium]|nr:hypothetical protein H0H92_009964 [Tricholoma furcatifolium]